MTDTDTAAFEARAQAAVAQGLLSADAVAPPPSPCINVCRMDDADRSNTRAQCIGCHRRISEIVEWGQATAARKRDIWRSLLQRAACRIEAASGDAIADAATFPIPNDPSSPL